MKKDFSDFLRVWQQRLGLVGWEIFIKASDKDGSRAWVEVDVPGRIATVFYSHGWRSSATREEQERVAFHESLEILLAPVMDDLGRYYSESQMATRAHEIIRVMENLWFGKKKGVSDVG